MTAPDPVTEIERMLQRGIGLDALAIGSSLISLSVRTRMKKRGIKTVAEYAEVVAESEPEFQALVEEIVVPETWFFRDPEAFKLLGEWAVREWLPNNAYGILRVISMPCSTGEEPYSIAMALLNAGLAPERFCVEAVDISVAAIEKAKCAIYSRNSFRGQHNEFRDTYFEKSGTGWRLGEQICRQVQFRQTNVLDEAFARKGGDMDVVFCRNLLIYFDNSARSRLMKKLGQMLSPDGLLFLGHAEGGIAREFGFEPLPKSMVFAFRKSAAKSASAPGPVRKSALPKPAARLELKPVILPLKAPASRSKAKPATTPPPAAESPEALLTKAEQSADAGRFDVARAQCETCLQAHGPSSRTYYLLGLIEDAANRAAQAESYYRKTLYIEPDHYEALFHLSLLARKGGDAKTAQQLEQRARRAQAKSNVKTKAS